MLENVKMFPITKSRFPPRETEDIADILQTGFEDT